MARYKNNSGRNRDGGFNLDGVNQTHFHEDELNHSHISHASSKDRNSASSRRKTASLDNGSSRRSTASLDNKSSRRPTANLENRSHSSHTREHRAASHSAAQSSRNRRVAAEKESHNYNHRASTGSHSRLASNHDRRDDHSAHSQSTNDYSRNSASSRYSGRNRKGKRKVLKIVLITLAILILAAGAAFAYWYSNIVGNLKSDENITNLAEENTSEPYYVLLLGGDSRADSKEDNRTDSIMVARVDEQNKKVSLMSVPRDLRVKIEDHGYCKINSAIEYGGYDQVINVVNNLFDIKISYYAFIYFSGFKDLVDKLGGVTVEVPEGTYYRGVTVPAGDAVKINGKEALVLARCRHGNPPDQGAYAMGDYQRTLNQRNLIKAIAKEILSKNVTEYPSLISGLSKCVETNMDVSKLISVATAMKGMNVNSIDAAQLPEAGDVVGGEWFAALYDDVFQVMKENFTSGKKITSGCANFDKENNGNDETSHCIDGEIYAYCNYTELYGDFKG